MSNNLDILDRKKQIQNYLLAANLYEALNILYHFYEDYFDEDRLEDVTKLQFRYGRMKGDENNGIVSREELIVTENKIVSDCLSLLRNGFKELDEKNISLADRNKFVGDKGQLEELLAETLREREIDNYPVAVLKNIKKRYLNSDFLFSLDECEICLGELVGVVGENSSGKTTFLRILGGDLFVDEGSINYPILDKLYNHQSWEDQKRITSFVSQELNSWTGGLQEGLRFEAAINGFYGDNNEARINKIVARLGLVNYLYKSWNELSMGYKLRFILAKALIKRAKLLIIDEPLAYLDLRAQIMILNDLKNLTKSLQYPIAVVLSSQHVHELEFLADKIFYINNGTTSLFKNNGSEYSYFELICDLKFDDIRSCLSDLNQVDIRWNGISYLLKGPSEISSEELLSKLFAKGVDVTLFRDISQSVKSKFYYNEA